ncbi:MAG TPA: N-acetylmuramoyl-L-alanine amidase [Verrucomicrobiae bacterium]|nr:N-acetylmuramoyl-L-alanine amidase [Verrucomicrobiae bacterium]
MSISETISETACLGCDLQHNGSVRFRANACGYLAVILLAGCASPNQRDSSHAPVWSDLNTVVQPSPVFPVAGPIDSGSSSPSKKPVSAIPAPLPTFETWVPLQRWSRVNNLGPVIHLDGAPSPTYALQTTNGSFVFHAGSQLSQWDGTEFRLGFAPQVIDGQPYIHGLDLLKTVQPLIQGGPGLAPANDPVIVIDPGHGGENAGTKSVLDNHYEKEFTLDWALRLQALLLAGHHKAFLTRSNDTDLALSNRVAFATQHKADLFISLHFNSAAPNENEAGLETYCLTPTGMPSSLTRGFPDEIRQTFPNNAFDPENLLLAARVHRALLEVNGGHDRGIRRARFPGVLRGQQRAAILVEGGYLSNRQEARLIEAPAYRQKLAEAVAKALMPSSGGSIALNSQAAQPVLNSAQTAGPVDVIPELPGKKAAGELPEHEGQ